MRNSGKTTSFKHLVFYLSLMLCTLLVFIAINAFIESKQSAQTNSVIADVHKTQQLKQQLHQQQATQQLILAVELIAADKALTQFIYSAAKLYQENPEHPGLTEIRQQLLPLLDGYWQSLKPFGASQLHLHLAPDAFTLLRAHRPERHSDRLATIRPMIMHSLNSGHAITAVEQGVHGLGLRSVKPLRDEQGKVVAAIELGFDLQNVFSTQFKTGFSAVESDISEGVALLVKPDITAVFHADTKADWFESTLWSAQNPSKMLQFWLSHNLLPEQVVNASTLVLHFEGQTYAVSLQPWSLWGQQAQSAQLLSLSWQDISQQLEAQQAIIGVTRLTWLIAGVLVLLAGWLLIFLLRKQAKSELTEHQQRVKKSEQKLSALYQLSPLPILLNRFSDGAFVEANPAMSKLVGYSLDELSKLSYWDLTPECYAEAEQLQLKSLTETGRYGPYVKQYKHKNGELIDIELNGVLFNDGEGESYIWTIIQDIREIKRVEKLKDDFVSTVSHELRTPLTSIAGSLGLVLGGAGGELSPKAEKLLSIAHKNSQRLNLLINDLLDIDKLMAGKMRFSEELVSLPELLAESIEQNQPYARQHKVSLNLSAVLPLNLWIDSARILQVLANFISNAVKFSPEGGEVLLTAELRGERVRVSIIDNGPGIMPIDQHRLFKRFSQLEQYEQAKGGTGLGLAISREIIIHSGGEVGVDSIPGEGATFWFELPVHQTLTKTDFSDKILVVEDDKDTAQLLCELLHMQNYATDWALDCESAWQKLSEQRFSAVTLDLQLKNENGADFFLKLRDNPATASLPVLIVSAYVEKGKLQLSAIANALDWIEKPVTPEILGLKLGQLLSQLPRTDRYHKILHIEDDFDIVTIMRLQLEALCEYQAVSTLAEAKAALAKERFELVLLDLGLPDGNGISLLPTILECQGEIPVVIFSAQDVSLADSAKVDVVFSKSRITTELLARYLKKMLN